MKITKTYEVQLDLVKKTKRIETQFHGSYNEYSYYCPKCGQNLTKLVELIDTEDLDLNFCFKCGYKITK